MTFGGNGLCYQYNMGYAMGYQYYYDDSWGLVGIQMIQRGVHLEQTEVRVQPNLQAWQQPNFGCCDAQLSAKNGLQLGSRRQFSLQQQKPPLFSSCSLMQLRHCPLAGSYCSHFSLTFRQDPFEVWYSLAPHVSLKMQRPSCVRTVLSLQERQQPVVESQSSQRTLTGRQLALAKQVRQPQNSLISRQAPNWFRKQSDDTQVVHTPLFKSYVPHSGFDCTQVPCRMQQPVGQAELGLALDICDGSPWRQLPSCWRQQSPMQVRQLPQMGSQVAHIGLTSWQMPDCEYCLFLQMILLHFFSYSLQPFAHNMQLLSGLQKMQNSSISTQMPFRGVWPSGHWMTVWIIWTQELLWSVKPCVQIRQVPLEDWKLAQLGTQLQQTLPSRYWLGAHTGLLGSQLWLPFACTCKLQPCLHEWQQPPKLSYLSQLSMTSLHCPQVQYLPWGQLVSCTQTPWSLAIHGGQQARHELMALSKLMQGKPQVGTMVLQPWKTPLQSATQLLQGHWYWSVLNFTPMNCVLLIRQSVLSTIKQQNSFPFEWYSSTNEFGSEPPVPSPTRLPPEKPRFGSGPQSLSLASEISPEARVSETWQVPCPLWQSVKSRQQRETSVQEPTEALLTCSTMLKRNMSAVGSAGSTEIFHSPGRLRAALVQQVEPAMVCDWAGAALGQNCPGLHSSTRKGLLAPYWLMTAVTVAPVGQQPRLKVDCEQGELALLKQLISMAATAPTSRSSSRRQEEEFGGMGLAFEQ